MSPEHRHQARVYRGHPENQEPERDRLWILAGLAGVGLGGCAFVHALGWDKALLATGQTPSPAEPAASPDRSRSASTPLPPQVARQNFSLEEGRVATAVSLNRDTNQAKEAATPVVKARAERSANFQPVPKNLQRGPTTGRMIALTFDIEQDPDNILSILQVLNKYQVCSTFFATGQFAATSGNTISSIMASGCNELGNHTYKHARADQETSAQLSEEITTTETAIASLGYTPSYWFRFPGNHFTQESLNTVVGQDLQAIGWSQDSRDWEGVSSQQIWQNVMPGISGGSIVLFHGHGVHTPEALETIIPQLQGQGFQLVTLSELFGVK
jgi:peptidoglycan/xylan/chitin deacetylase (PgdA/CDA1 family)